MENLAGNPECDKIIEREFLRCGIEVIRGSRSTGEVATTITGKLGVFTFERAWYYMVASGKVPLEVAKILYDDIVGKTDIRVAGHCGCPPPESPWISWYDSDHFKLCNLDAKAEFDRLIDEGSIPKELVEGYRFVEDPAAVGKGFIENYHIDSELGLRIFADTLKKYQLA